MERDTTLYVVVRLVVVIVDVLIRVVQPDPSSIFRRQPFPIRYRSDDPSLAVVVENSQVLGTGYALKANEIDGINVPSSQTGDRKT